MIENGCSVRAGPHSCLNHSQGYLNQGRDNRPIPSYILTIFLTFSVSLFSCNVLTERGISDFLPELPHFFLAFCFWSPGHKSMKTRETEDTYPRTEKAEFFVFLFCSLFQPLFHWTLLSCLPDHHILNVDSRIRQSKLHIRLELTSFWFLQNIFSLMFCRKNVSTQCQTVLGADRNQTLPSLDCMRIFSH